MQINDCINCFVELHSHMQDFFTCKEASVAMLKGQNLSLRKKCALLTQCKKTPPKKMAMVMSIMFVVFIVSLLQENIKQTIATRFLFLQNKKNKKNVKQVNKEIFLTCKEASVLIFINVKSYKKKFKI
jgi:hypothetical protein